MTMDKEKISRRLASLTAAKPVAAPPPPEKKRATLEPREERRPSFRFGKVILEDHSELRCVLKDFSASGARIVLEGAFTLSPVVTLKVDATGERRKASVVWQKEAEIGLSFARRD
jgi:hypothetical protein